MSSTGTVTTSKDCGVTRGAGWMQFNFDYPAFPSGSTPSRYKVDSTNTSLGLREETGARNRDFSQWYDDPSEVILDGNSGCRIYLKNDTSQYISATVTITFEYVIPYTAVTAGNKIGIADINQTGTSISSGTKLQASLKSGLTAGNKITAADFNSIVLGL